MNTTKADVAFGLAAMSFLMTGGHILIDHHADHGWIVVAFGFGLYVVGQLVRDDQSSAGRAEDDRP